MNLLLTTRQQGRDRLGIDYESAYDSYSTGKGKKGQTMNLPVTPTLLKKGTDYESDPMAPTLLEKGQTMYLTP